MDGRGDRVVRDRGGRCLPSRLTSNKLRLIHSRGYRGTSPKFGQGWISGMLPEEDRSRICNRLQAVLTRRLRTAALVA
jgi:hypothetical protein